MATTWTAPTVAMVTAEFSPQEIASIAAQQGASNLTGILSRVVDEIQGAILSGNYCTQADLAASDNSGKIPPDLHTAAIDLARWRLLVAMPALKAMQTKEREAAAERAQKKIEAIAEQKFAVRAPTASTTDSPSGQWGSENKLILRTHPVPRPASQQPVDPDNYANPEQPEDSAAT